MKNSKLARAGAACVFACALSLPASLLAQSKNAALLSNWRPTNGTANDIWGFDDPKNGKAYCLLGTTAGTYVLDVSDPTKPVSRGYFAASLAGLRSSTWRDIKYWKSYAYIVTEASNSGIQILDLREPDKPVYAGHSKPTNLRWTGGTHNIALDPDTGFLYCCGTNGGTHIFDPNANPTSPRFVATWASPYIHDLAIQDGFAHVSYIGGQAYGILDVRSLPAIRELGRARVPACHNNWATADNRYSVTTSESSAGPVGIFDIRDRTAPKLVINWRANRTTSPRAIPHNAYIQDYLIHVAYYTEGYRVVDMSRPATPVEVGYYDTWPGSSTGFNGQWGCYPFARSGIIYASDRTTGLYLIKPAATASRRGKGTKGTNGAVPHIHLKGAAWIGNPSFAIGTRDARANSVAISVLSDRAAQASFGGLEILVDFTNPILLIAPTDASGTSQTPIPIPNDNKLAGAKLHPQSFVLDAGASALNLSSSEALEFSLFKN